MGKIAEKNQNFFQRYHAVLLPLMLALLSYAGIDGGTAAYEAYYAEPPVATTKVEVHVAADDSPTHAHGKVYSREDVEQIVNSAVAAERARAKEVIRLINEAMIRDRAEHETFKRKEDWE